MSSQSEYIHAVLCRELERIRRYPMLSTLLVILPVLSFAFFSLFFSQGVPRNIPVAVLGSMAVLSAVLWGVDSQHYMSPLFHLLTGGALLGAIFMATDYVTSPMTHRGMLIYGCGIGVLTILIRTWGAYPEGMSFAILIMNSVVPLLNKYVKPRRFGVKK